MRKVRNLVGLVMFALVILGYTQEPLDAIGCGQKVYDQQGVMCHWSTWCDYGYGDFSCGAWCGSIYGYLSSYCGGQGQGGYISYFTCNEGGAWGECTDYYPFMYGNFQCEGDFSGYCP